MRTVAGKYFAIEEAIHKEGEDKMMAVAIERNLAGDRIGDSEEEVMIFMMTTAVVNTGCNILAQFKMKWKKMDELTGFSNYNSLSVEAFIWGPDGQNHRLTVLTSNTASNVGKKLGHVEERIVSYPVHRDFRCESATQGYTKFGGSSGAAKYFSSGTADAGF